MFEKKNAESNQEICVCVIWFSCGIQSVFAGIGLQSCDPEFDFQSLVKQI